MAGFLDKMKGLASPYHICYQVDNIELAVCALKCMNYVVTSPLAAAVAFDGRRVVFLIKRDAGLIELVER